jgi:DNA-binding NtrC family response regulator
MVDPEMARRLKYFRGNLLHRLRTHFINKWPLRDRMDDIPSGLSEDIGRMLQGFSDLYQDLLIYQ